MRAAEAQEAATREALKEAKANLALAKAATAAAETNVENAENQANVDE